MALDDELLNTVTWKIPNALALIGSRAGDERNAMTALNGRPVRPATTGAPVFDEAVAWMDCAVRHAFDLGTHTLFVGEVVDAAIQAPDARPASMRDTRMKYGGVKRH
jgi:flavin reductase (DIM6/NTAB) family NADH-FMN oxidoreductase RutF